MAGWFSKSGKDNGPDLRSIAVKWVEDYGIQNAIDAEDASGITPADVGWDMKCVWTSWDSYDVVGAYVEAGYSEKEDDGDRFVTGWYLGTVNASGAPDVEILGREVCPSCDTEGCRKCDELGWFETDFLATIASKIEWISRRSRASPAFCEQCGFKFGDSPKFCGGCGAKVGSTSNPVSDVEIPEGIRELARSVLLQAEQLVENENILRIDFYKDGSESVAFSLMYDLGVIDTEFDEEVEEFLEKWEPFDDDESEGLGTKHVYLEPDDFQNTSADDAGGALIADLLMAIGCLGPQDLSATILLKKPHGAKPTYVITEH